MLERCIAGVAAAPAGFLTITAYSGFELSRLRMVPYHSTPPLKKKIKMTEPRLLNSPPSPPLPPLKEQGGGEEEKEGRGADFWLGWPTQ